MVARTSSDANPLDRSPGSPRSIFRSGSPTRTTLLPALAIALGALLLFAPSAGAQAGVTNVAHVAPFHGTPHLGQISTKLGCSAAASFAVAPAFNLTSGLGKLSSKSSAKGCGPVGLSDFGATEGIAGFDSASFLWTHTATVSLSFSESLTFVANLSSTPVSPAGGASAWAAYHILLEFQVWNVSGSSVGNGYSLALFGSTNSSTSGYSNVSQTQSAGFTFPNSGFYFGYTYVVQMFVTAYEFAYAPAHTSTHAAAKLNIATGGNLFQALSWSYS
jgi:hypothetical protein